MCVGRCENSHSAFFLCARASDVLSVCVRVHLAWLFVCILCLEARIGLSVTVKSAGVGGTTGVAERGREEEKREA